MAFSAIMLTTDAHNPRVTEKMTKAQFVALTRGMNGEGNFPKVIPIPYLLPCAPNPQQYCFWLVVGKLLVGWLLSGWFFWFAVVVVC